MQDKSIYCWKCSEQLEVPSGPLPFKSICESCLTWQHACVNCKYYQIGKPNDCLVPNTESVQDRESFNLCGEFDQKSQHPLQKNENKKSKSEIEKLLFGDEADENQDNDQKISHEDRFNSLFDD